MTGDEAEPSLGSAQGGKQGQAGGKQGGEGPVCPGIALLKSKWVDAEVLEKCILRGYRCQEAAINGLLFLQGIPSTP